MKMVFLFDKEIRKKFNLGQAVPDDIFPKFDPHDFGPFSEQVYVDLEFLVNLNFVTAKSLANRKPSQEEESEYKYWQANSGVVEADNPKMDSVEFSLSQKGKSFVKDKLVDTFNSSQWEILDKFKERCAGVSLTALLKYVYTKYPETTEKSKISDKILRS